MWLYTALGDSITAGESATAWHLAYPSLVTSHLRSRRARATGEVLAVPGWTSTDLRFSVFEHSAVYLAEANVITIWVGGDNLASAGIAVLNGAGKGVIERALIRYVQDLSILVRGIKNVSRGQIILCTQYNPFPNTPIAGSAIAQLNQATARVASQQGARIADTYSWFEGLQAELIAGYRSGRLEDAVKSPRVPVHPNNRGHQLIARNLLPILADC